MTFLEKAMEIDKSGGREQHPNALIRRNCPFDYGLEESDVCNRVGQEKCFECWNREMPNTEPKEDASLKDYKDFTDDLLNQGYNKGLNDAWELVKKLFEMENDKFREAFPPHTYVSSVMNTYTPQEAIAKLKAYEEAQIEVGDVVNFKGNVFVVIRKAFDSVLGIDRNGETWETVIEECKKTGKHIDIQSILAQIGE